MENSKAVTDSYQENDNAPSSLRDFFNKYCPNTVTGFSENYCKEP
jgi:hypothetical protein